MSDHQSILMNKKNQIEKHKESILLRFHPLRHSSAMFFFFFVSQFIAFSFHVTSLKYVLYCYKSLRGVQKA